MPIACGGKRAHVRSKPAGLLLNAALTAALAMVLSGTSPALADVPPPDHAAHHPGQAMPQAAPMPQTGPMQGLTYAPAYGAGQYAAPTDIPKTALATMPSPSAPSAPPMSGSSTVSTSGAGQMMAMMGEMSMPQPAFYPSLMAMPEVGPEQRVSLEMQSRQSISAGAALMTNGLVQLSRRTAEADALAVRNALNLIKQGAALTEAGLSGQRVLAGEAPQQVALGWFRRQMNMPSLVEANDEWVIYGLTPFHLTVMVALILASVTLVTAYIYRMGAAAQLVRRISAHLPHLTHRAPAAPPTTPTAAPVPSPPAEPAEQAATSRASPGKAPVPTSEPGPAEVVFSRSGKTVILEPGETLYDAAERAEVEISGSCLAGTCNGCKIKVVQGDILTEGEDTAHAVKDSMVLACQSYPRGKVIVRA
ncbi:hypothetical protein CXZ10_01005 [Pleomorphomonas diazotrophica]|uniref:2Fe-2S ferredoxin-type domain-containing protein n=1 Tax=Pleomorphomonas diazotrophica TaxID=1166257 RepID=A0A2N3LZJ8_9HYPH|nr:2Fe-2S iron-sulfur cluster binding domain-containing protein [Pleomorphomonas diazotrophica]PKR90003.1 hypothetical protein CXZ10_01005 [Pleomorphomonas diazotrophica]